MRRLIPTQGNRRYLKRFAFVPRIVFHKPSGGSVRIWLEWYWKEQYKGLLYNSWFDTGGYLTFESVRED